MGYAIIFFMISILYLGFGITALLKNYKNINNKLYFIITFSFSFWALIYSVLYLVTDPEIAASLRKLTVITWGTMYSVILHLMILLTGFNKYLKTRFKKTAMYMLLYIPAFLNLLLYIFESYNSSELIRTSTGWVVSSNVDRGYIWDNFFFYYYSIFMILSIIVVVIWRLKTEKLREKTYSKYLLIALMFPLVLGSIFEIILPLNGIDVIDGITLLFSLVSMVIVYFIIEKYGFLSYDLDELGSNFINLASEGVIICDLNGKIESINQGAIDMLGYEKTNKLNNILQIGLEIKDYSTVKSKEKIFDCENGAKVPVLLSTKEINDNVGELFGYLLVFQDLSELKSAQNKLQELNNSLEKTIEIRTKDLISEIKNRKKAENENLHIAYNDYLTGLYNRRYYEDALVQLDKEEFYPLSLVMADINGLKLINDAFGHKAGDELLIKAASIIKAACRERDVLSRIGGDEFVIIMPNTTGKEADEVIKSINKEAKKVVINSISLSISFGYRTKTNNIEQIQEVFRNAEDLMYREKLLKIPSMRSSAIEAILKTLYEKDKDSEIHSRAVALYSEKIAEACGFERQVVSEAKTAGLLHDIGKILIAQRILTKKGKLTNAEYEEMKNHSEIGFRVLNSSHETRRISNIVLHHHERWDGRGYPMNVKGDKIPLISRIIAIADSFDAMTSKRTYKEKISKEAALKEIIDNSGTQFDPDLVEIFRDNFYKIIHIKTD